MGNRQVLTNSRFCGVPIDKLDPNKVYTATVTGQIEKELHEQIEDYWKEEAMTVNPHLHGGQRATPLATQVGGDHYKSLAIQPIEYSLKNNLNFVQASVVKYVTRYKDKGGKEDLRKAIHNIELLLEIEYGETK